MRKLDFYSRALRGGIAAACATLAVATAQAGPNQIITFDAPGAGTILGTGTYPAAISGKSVITGSYTDDNHVSHGFIGTATGAMTAFDPPDAGTDPYEGTHPTAINASGAVAGYYVTSKAHGFLRQGNGTIEEFDIGVGQDTTPLAINNKGVITGTAGLSGFVRKANGNISQFSVGGASSTGPRSINAAGTVAGSYYLTDGTQHGFLRTSDGTITTFDVPGGFDSTYVTSINSEGDITGFAFNNAAYVGFVRKGSDGTYSIFYNIGGCQVNRVFPYSINFDGTVVGQCYDDNFVYHGFIRSSDGTTKLIDAPNASAGTYPVAISANGKAVGYAFDNLSVAHGFRMNAGKP